MRLRQFYSVQVQKSANQKKEADIDTKCPVWRPKNGIR